MNTKLILPFICIFFGFVLPQLGRYSFLIKYLIMISLFFSFLKIKIHRKIFRISVIYILIANISIAFLTYGFVSLFNKEIALIAFITALAPTAASAPVVVAFLGGEIEYVTTSVLLTNILIVVLMPIFITMIFPVYKQILTIRITISTISVIFIPLIITQLIHHYLSSLRTQILKYEAISFYSWLIVIFLAVSTSSQFIVAHHEISLTTMITVSLIVLMICFLNFTLGRIIGGREYGLEGSQSLGQKNTTFMIWFSLTYLNPIVALGPIFYIIYHNIYNSYQIFLIEKKKNIIKIS